MNALRDHLGWLRRERPPAPERDGLTRIQERDRFEQQSLRPPDSELVQVRLVLVCEVYGPDRASALVDGAVALGLRARVGHPDIETLLADLRRGGGSAGPIPLGMVIRSEHREPHPFFGETATADLPTGVLNVLPAVAVVGGSLSVLVCAFRLDEESGTSVHRALTAEHLTERAPDGTGYQPPMMSQRRATDTARQLLAESCARWVHTHMPGEFAALSVSLPSLLLQTHRTAEAEHAGGLSQWSMNVRAEQARWRSTRWPALSLGEPHSIDGKSNMLLIVGREQAVLQRYREPGVTIAADEAWEYTTARLTQSLQTTVMAWAIQRLLGAHRHEFAKLRDTIAGWDVEPRSAAERLTALAPTARMLVNSRAIAAGVASGIDGQLLVGYDANDWIHSGRRGGSWFEMQLTGLPPLADDLLSEEQELRERVGLEIDLLDAGAGLQVQRTALWVSAGAALLAAAALAVSAVQLLSNSASSNTTTTITTATTVVTAASPPPTRTAKSPRPRSSVRRNTKSSSR